MYFKKWLLLAVIALSFNSCAIFTPVSLVPSFNAAIVQDVVDLGKQVDAMYLTMEQSADKKFTTYLPNYSAAEVAIISIIERDELRPKSSAIVRQANLYRELFLKYRDEHKAKNTLNNSEIRIYRQYLKDQLKPLLISEMSLN